MNTTVAIHIGILALQALAIAYTFRSKGSPRERDLAFVLSLLPRKPGSKPASYDVAYSDRGWVLTKDGIPVQNTETFRSVFPTYGEALQARDAVPQN